jgi:hypothetical protein
MARRMTDQERAMMQSYSVNGVRMDLDTGEAIQQQMARGAYEPTESAWVRRHLGPGSVFVDVGANFGWFTTLACPESAGVDTCSRSSLARSPSLR